MNENQNYTEEFEEQVNIRKVVFKYLSFWKWMALSAFVFLSIAFLYLRYTQSIYVSKASVLIKDDKSGGMPGMAIFEDLGLSGGSSNLENEIQIFKSRKLIELVVKKLELTKRYVIRGERSGLKSSEVYTKTPIQINHGLDDSLSFVKPISFDVTLRNDSTFELSEINGVDFGLVRFGEAVNSSRGPVVFTKTTAFNGTHINLEYVVSITPLSNAITALQKGLSVEAINKDAEILLISLNGSVIAKNNAIINDLIFQHELEEIKEKNEITENTRDFIKDRMLFISKELSGLDNASLRFKTEHNLIDVGINTQLLLEKDSDIEKAIVETNIQLELVRFMNEIMSTDVGVDNLLPSNRV